MSVKSDRWIRRMAEEQGLIEPFDARLVREDGGRRIISAGASSYGYDMRLADDGFRVFSPIHGREIDPKKFDDESLVEPPLREADDGSRYYLLPPHSYALGVSVETFRMPRNVTAICMCKCLTRDARVVDAATGDLLSIADFAKDGAVLSYGAGGRLGGHEAMAVISQGRKRVHTVRTRLGHKITATDNHPFLTPAGWVSLGDLAPGSRIAAARRVPIFGSEPIAPWEATLLGLMISEGQCHTPGSSPVFTSTDGVLVEALTLAVADGLGSEVTFNGHHGYRLVNKSGRGGKQEPNRATAWLMSHGLNVGALEKFVPACVFRAPKAGVALFLRALFSGDGSIFLQGAGHRAQAVLEYGSSSERLARDVQHLLLRFGIVSQLKEKRTAKAPAYVVQILRRADVRLFLNEIGFWPGSVKDRRVTENVRPVLDAQTGGRQRLHDTIPPGFWAVMRKEAEALGTTLHASGIHVRGGRDVSYSDLRKFLTRNPQSGLWAQYESDVIWDEIVSVEERGVEEVFDICVPRVSNFVANNLIVHNSTYARAGLMLNTTPLEAGWTGRLVIELGNLADLPLRVYVGEGIGQVIFFESDEDCDVSYEDRGGKYQGQTGLTYSRL